MNLKKLPDVVLVAETKACVAREREMTLLVLQHLREIERRMLFAHLGFSSLFEYVTRALGYDNASAMRRIDAMRLLREIPAVEEKVKSGKLTLSTAARAQGFFKKESVDSEKKKEILIALENKSTREAEKTLLQFSRNPATHLFHEQIKPVSPELSEVRFYADDTLLDQLEKLKGLLAHIHPNMTTGDLIAYLSRMGLERLDPAVRKIREKKMVTAPNQSVRQRAEVSLAQMVNSTRAAMASEVSPARRREEGTAVRRTAVIPRSRRPGESTIRAVWKRDAGRCVWKNFRSGKICGSRFGIQVDHIFPWALGGDHSLSNLRCLCFRHNRLEAEKWFGKWSKKIDRYPLLCDNSKDRYLDEFRS